jgi:16S rRNA (cytosine1402-N4)-methyltransferase
MKEAVDGLNIIPNGIYVDATFGRGGHSKEILNRLGPTGHLVAIDRDPDAVKHAAFINDPRLQVHHAKFSSLPFILKQESISKIDGLLLDLGVSSPQVDNKNRGFSFVKNGPLDMRMDPTTGSSVSTWLKTANLSEIQNVLSIYGEERFSKSIATAICQQREKDKVGGEGVFETTKDLAELIIKIYTLKGKRNHGSKHPATKSFQAFRVYINNEIDELVFLLTKIPEIIVTNGRVCIISFHSIEDRIVKKNMRSSTNSVSRSDRMTPKQYAFFSSINRIDKSLSPKIRQIKRILPSIEEIKINARARSAVLRVGELVNGNEKSNIKKTKNK